MMEDLDCHQCYWDAYCNRLYVVRELHMALEGSTDRERERERDVMVCHQQYGVETHN